MQHQFSTLQCYLLPTKEKYCLTHLLPHYEKTISFWHHIIQNALREEKNIDEANHLSQDIFTQNDEVVVLFDAENLIGLFMFQWIDIKNAEEKIILALEKRFSKKLFEQLREEKITYVMLMGQLAVHPDWRKISIGYGISDLLIGFSLCRFLESKAETLLTTTRNNRRTNDLGYRQGAKKFADNGIVLNVPSDILCWHREDVRPIPFEELHFTMQTLWRNKIIGWIDMPLPFMNDVTQTII